MRPAWAEIDLDALRSNVAHIKSLLQADTHYLAVVKANAYGHGDVACAKAALQAGATWLGVILVSEGRRLREAGIEAPILTLHEPHPHEADEALALGLTPSVFTERAIEALGAAAQRLGVEADVHLKVDTGLNRLGIPVERVEEALTALGKTPLHVQGLFSHFAFADQPDHPFIDSQLANFEQARARVRDAGITPEIEHIANSAATLTRPETHFDLVRVGIATYGLAPGERLRDAMPYRPVMSFKAEVAMVKRVRAGEGVSYGLRYVLERDATIASIPLGYADGWHRLAGGNATVLVNGKPHPTVGTVCMDSFMVDVGDDECAVGDEVVLFGPGNPVEGIAQAMSTINYEVVTSVSARVPRIITGGTARG